MFYCDLGATDFAAQAVWSDTQTRCLWRLVYLALSLFVLALPCWSAMLLLFVLALLCQSAMLSAFVLAPLCWLVALLVFGLLLRLAYCLVESLAYRLRRARTRRSFPTNTDFGQ